MRKESTTSICTGSDTAGTSCQNTNAVSDVAVMIRAHYKWVDAGRPKGDGRPFWVEAERELRQEAEQPLRGGHHEVSHESLAWR